MVDPSTAPVMIVYLHTSTFRRIQWHDYATRFVLGGLISAGAAIIANKFGTSLGGLFLAFLQSFPPAPL
jgi:hypothetical protein